MPKLVLGLVCFSAVVLFAVGAKAQSASTSAHVQKAKYSVYAGGLHALDVNLTTDLSAKERYSVNMDAKTYGMLNKLAPWQGTFKTNGWKGDVFKPEKHKSTATFRGEGDSKTYSYGKDGSFKKFTLVENGKVKSDTPDKKLTNGTTDILTSTLNTLREIGAGKGCSGSDEIFDGKRRFKLSFKQVRETTLEQTKYNAYAGKAVECTAVVEPVAGEWHEKPRGWASIQEQGRSKGSLPTVWFAAVEEGKPAIPVKVRVKTDYGTLFMHLTQYQSAGKKMTSKKAK